MKELLLGILLITIVGVGGLIYRNAVEQAREPVACPLDARLCPDGTAVGRTGNSCTFAACPPPNVSLSELNIAFALPEGFSEMETFDEASVAAYGKTLTASSTFVDTRIVVRRYSIPASSTPLAVIQETAVGSPSGLPVPTTSFTSTLIGSRRFTVVPIERFEATIVKSYYLARTTDVLRFDAMDMNVADWTDPQLNVDTLPAQAALRQMLSTLQGE